MQIQKETSLVSATLPVPEPKPACRVLSSADLLGPDGRLIIQHDGQLYSLQRTKGGKLILTK